MEINGNNPVMMEAVLKGYLNVNHVLDEIILEAPEYELLTDKEQSQFCGLIHLESTAGLLNFPEKEKKKFILKQLRAFSRYMKAKKKK